LLVGPVVDCTTVHRAGSSPAFLPCPKLRLPALQPIPPFTLTRIPSRTSEQPRPSFEDESISRPPFPSPAYGSRGRRAATAPNAPLVTLSLSDLHQNIVPHSLSCDVPRSSSGGLDARPDSSSGQSSIQQDNMSPDSEDACFRNGTLAPGDPLLVWYNKQAKCQEWRNRVDNILCGLMDKCLDPQKPNDPKDEERLRHEVADVRLL
jgi:hypothetical protein